MCEMARLLSLCAACVVLCACNAAKRTEVNNSAAVRAVHVGGGIACARISGMGTVSYASGDLGKPGVPRLSAAQERVLRSLIRAVHSPFLRFAFVGGQFIVFDATDGACSGGAYAVLNAPCQVYSPTDNLGYITAASRNGCR